MHTPCGADARRNEARNQRQGRMPNPSPHSPPLRCAEQLAVFVKTDTHSKDAHRHHQGGMRAASPSQLPSAKERESQVGKLYVRISNLDLVLWCFVLNPHQPHARLKTRRRRERNTNELCGPSHKAPATSSPRPSQNLASSPPEHDRDPF